MLEITEWTNPVNSPLSVMVIVVAILGAAWDLKSRKIPNWLTLSSALIGLGMRFFFNGFHGLTVAFLGVILGIALLVLVYLMGGMGAGDVKLLGALGAFLGPWLILAAFLWMALAGGIIAIGLILWKKALKTTFHNLKTIFLSFLMGIPPHETKMTIENQSLLKLPYGLPIAVGAIMAVWLQDIPRWNF